MVKRVEPPKAVRLQLWSISCNSLWPFPFHMLKPVNLSPLPTCQTHFQTAACSFPLEVLLITSGTLVTLWEVLGRNHAGAFISMWSSILPPGLWWSYSCRGCLSSAPVLTRLPNLLSTLFPFYFSPHNLTL